MWTETLHDTEAKGIFENETPLTKKVEAKTNEGYYTKLRNFCTSKEMVTELQRQSTDWENIFTQYPSLKGLTYARHVRHW